MTSNSLGCLGMEEYQLMLQHLWKVHQQEFEGYYTNAASYPKYYEEWTQFIQKRSATIVELGQDPQLYDFEEEWKIYWPGRLTKIEVEEWNEKKLNYTALSSRMSQTCKNSKRNRTSSESSQSRSSSPSKSKSRSRTRSGSRKRSMSGSKKRSRSGSRKRSRSGSWLGSKPSLKRKTRSSSRSESRESSSCSSSKSDSGSDRQRPKRRKTSSQRKGKSKHRKEKKSNRESPPKKGRGRSPKGSNGRVDQRSIRESSPRRSGGRSPRRSCERDDKKNTRESSPRRSSGRSPRRSYERDDKRKSPKKAKRKHTDKSTKTDPERRRRRSESKKDKGEKNITHKGKYNKDECREQKSKVHDKCNTKSERGENHKTGDSNGGITLSPYTDEMSPLNSKEISSTTESMSSGQSTCDLAKKYGHNMLSDDVSKDLDMIFEEKLGQNSELQKTKGNNVSLNAKGRQAKDQLNRGNSTVKNSLNNFAQTANIFNKQRDECKTDLPSKSLQREGKFTRVLRLLCDLNDMNSTLSCQVYLLFKIAKNTEAAGDDPSKCLDSDKNIYILRRVCTELQATMHSERLGANQKIIRKELLKMVEEVLEAQVTGSSELLHDLDVKAIAEVMYGCKATDIIAFISRALVCSGKPIPSQAILHEILGRVLQEQTQLHVQL